MPDRALIPTTHDVTTSPSRVASAGRYDFIISTVATISKFKTQLVLLTWCASEWV